MIGRNLYEELRGSREWISESMLNELLETAATYRPTTCIFLSHKGDDKAAVIEIGVYIKKAGINIYLDIEDPGLQRAVDQSDDVAITKFIELGISRCTHLMTVVSEKTKQSWWVSYEIGFAKRAFKELATLKLKDVQELPSFLKITRILEGRGSLNGYLCSINPSLAETQSKNKYLMESVTGNTILRWFATGHPLIPFLAGNK